MSIRRLALPASLFLMMHTGALAQDHPAPAPSSKGTKSASANPEVEAEQELQRAVASAGNDRAALVRNLKNYIERFPEAPRRASVYRALVESCGQLRDTACALDYAERFIAIQPEDNEMMLLAVDLLKQQGSDAGLTRANGYISRVLDRVRKLNPDERTPRTSLPEWQDHHEKLLAALYFQRGQIETLQQSYEDAAKDLQSSYSIRANAPAAEALGEIAELRGEPARAIEEYSLAFALPEAGPGGPVDRREIRRKLGNVWRQVHGSDQGLAEKLLATYDELAVPPATPNPAARNKGAKDPLDFVLRRTDGSLEPLAPFRGKTVVLSFWATWCGPCRELERELGQVEQSYKGNSDVIFLAVNTDEDESLVTPFLARANWSAVAVYADGLDGYLQVTAIPTVVILSREGKIVYRISGFTPNSFRGAVTAAIQSALNPPK